jgi:hypothetical protein
MKLECESSHTKIDNGMTFSEAKTLNKADFDAAIDTAEREAIDKAFDNAQFSLAGYKCKSDCERRFAVNIGPRAVFKAQPQKINGATLYKALVFIDWTLDIECKRRKPGGGIPHGRPE